MLNDHMIVSVFLTVRDRTLHCPRCRDRRRRALLLQNGKLVPASR
jgi:hypothetical protein